MQLEHPVVLVALVPLALLAVLVALRRRDRRHLPAILFSRPRQIAAQRPSLRLRLARLRWVTAFLAMALLIAALARPREGRADSEITSEGIDIMMLVDTSGSMAAEDFGGGLTRLDHVVEVVREFVGRRAQDRIGIVGFGAAAWTRAPLTLDHELVTGVLQRIRDDWHRDYDRLSLHQALHGRAAPGDMTPAERDLQGTAIGDALITAVARLERSEASSKVIILLTDGENTDGVATPQAGAELAARFGIKVYAVGAGRTGEAWVKVFDQRGRPTRVSRTVRLDEDTLKEVAELTDGAYFHASDRRSLEAVYRRIDELERSEIVSRDFTEWNEHFTPFALAALVLLVLDGVLAATALRRVP